MKVDERRTVKKRIKKVMNRNENGRNGWEWFKGVCLLHNCFDNINGIQYSIIIVYNCFDNNRLPLILPLTDREPVSPFHACLLETLEEFFQSFL